MQNATSRDCTFARSNQCENFRKSFFTLRNCFQSKYQNATSRDWFLRGVASAKIWQGEFSPCEIFSSCLPRIWFFLNSFSNFNFLVLTLLSSSPCLDKIFKKKFHGQKPFLKPSQLHFSCTKHYSSCISSLGRVLHCSKVSNFSFFSIFGSLNCLFMSFLCFRNHKHAFSSIKTISKIYFFKSKTHMAGHHFCKNLYLAMCFRLPNLLHCI